MKMDKLHSKVIGRLIKDQDLEYLKTQTDQFIRVIG